ncbi:hypothetical protein PCH_Pc15g01020 [Penicillium rubens Wisconsin 54-1255]|uniref:Uncharacterized protein n=1 Tax=Penicillium rubens (strain ATCC 28089 / DSM 1075 / NRRL 1951 / Wisconsin 54-1255) TaxID=500485 RepID=B6H6P6_PENRW|nr:hypothetical protein PCH_Pc15g01020 [Penicillium rubens Wisconsin 54-1255]
MGFQPLSIHRPETLDLTVPRPPYKLHPQARPPDPWSSPATWLGISLQPTFTILQSFTAFPNHFCQEQQPWNHGSHCLRNLGTSGYLTWEQPWKAALSEFVVCRLPLGIDVKEGTEGTEGNEEVTKRGRKERSRTPYTGQIHGASLAAPILPR